VWDWREYNKNRYNDSNVRISIGIHQDISFGLHYNFGSNWPSYFGYKSYKSGDIWAYVADYTTILVAPYTGKYVFYMNSDDDSYLYGSHEVIDSKDSSRRYQTTEVLLMSTSYSPRRDFVSQISRSRSSSVHLERGDRYHIRVRLINYQGPDFLEVAMKVTPDYDKISGYLIDGMNYLNGLDANLNEEIKKQNPIPLQFSDAFLQYRSLKDVQLVNLNMKYQLEVQVNNISLYSNAV
jgi:hypothetical protein